MKLLHTQRLKLVLKSLKSLASVGEKSDSCSLSAQSVVPGWQTSIYTAFDAPAMPDLPSSASVWICALTMADSVEHKTIG